MPKPAGACSRTNRRSRAAPRRCSSAARGTCPGPSTGVLNLAFRSHDGAVTDVEAGTLSLTGRGPAAAPPRCRPQSSRWVGSLQSRRKSRIHAHYSSARSVRATGSQASVSAEGSPRRPRRSVGCDAALDVRERGRLRCCAVRLREPCRRKTLADAASRGRTHCPGVGSHCAIVTAVRAVAFLPLPLAPTCPRRLQLCDENASISVLVPSSRFEHRVPRRGETDQPRCLSESIGIGIAMVDDGCRCRELKRGSMPYRTALARNPRQRHPRRVLHHPAEPAGQGQRTGGTCAASPHTRGSTGSGCRDIQAVAPHGRGCPRLLPRPRRRRPVCPALAGMSLSACRPGLSARVCPARAGMSPARGSSDGPTFRLPRTRGDVPLPSAINVKEVDVRPASAGLNPPTRYTE